MPCPTLTRRHALLAGAALPFAASLAAALPPRPALAAAEMLGTTTPQFYRFRLGRFEVTTLLSGSRTGDKPQETFGLNVEPSEFAAVSAANFIPADKTRNFFTPTLVNTGAELVLFDTGLNPQSITAALATAGYAPDQVDIVVLTHMHGDHIGGLMTEAGPTFANARYVTGAVEHNHWMAASNDGFDRSVRPLNDKIGFVDDGGTVVSGITAMFAPGHTPGHMTYMLESDGTQLALLVDTANHYVWSLAYPDWEVRFDIDKPTAAATRRRFLAMLAAERVPFIGYHMPFPALGYVAPRAGGFRYVPASYQMLLDG
ncbi:MAG: MBL fold metallo-hydrolase [Pseudorhodobacter sp.]|nr:MBL fold metallo-hydrolase [Pseudorhodobacter sp.]